MPHQKRRKSLAHHGTQAQPHTDPVPCSQPRRTGSRSTQLGPVSCLPLSCADSSTPFTFPPHHRNVLGPPDLFANLVLPRRSPPASQFGPRESIRGNKTIARRISGSEKSGGATARAGTSHSSEGGTSQVFGHLGSAFLVSKVPLYRCASGPSKRSTQ